MSEALFSVRRDRLTPFERDFIDFVGRHALQDDLDLTREIKAARKGEYSAEGMDQVVPFNHVTFGVAQEKETEEEDGSGVYHTIDLAVVTSQPAGETFIMRGGKIRNLHFSHIYSADFSFFTSQLGEGAASDDQTSELVIRGAINGLDRLEHAGQMVPYALGDFV